MSHASEHSDDIFMLVAQGSADMQALVDPQGRYRYVSPASLTLFGWPAGQVENLTQLSFAHVDDRAQLVADTLQARRGEQPTTAYRFRCADGSYRWVEAVTRRVTAEPNGMLVTTVRDIANRKSVEQGLRRQLATDPLTGVGNRTLFVDRLHHAMHRLSRQPGLVAVLILDIDRFKKVNDALGHAAGDVVLAQLAGRLLVQLRPADTLVRLGGDEFAIVAEDLSSRADAVALADRLTTVGQTPLKIGLEELVCTVSVGISITDDARLAPEELLQEADLALYRAKDRGRDRAELFDEELRTRAVGRLATERLLRRAVEEKRLRVEYQPVVRTADWRVVGAEALLRIADPDRGELLRPDRFLAVADQTGLLAQIDGWVLEQALEQGAQWVRQATDSGFEQLTVNMTARHLADARLAGSTLELLDRFAVEPHHLQIDLPEPVLMEASAAALDTLQSLRRAGIRVGLDDFGTGYSSLTCLRQFPIDLVKLDKTVIDRLCDDPDERRVTGATIELCHAAGLTVVAEGVEQPDQAAALRELGCDYAQGYTFGRSEPPAVFRRRLTGRPAGPTRS